MATTTSVSGSDSITGTDGSEKLVGGAGSDTIDGGAGSDFINAGGGDDWIIYDQNDYKILGGGGIDTLWFMGTNQNLNFGTQAVNGVEALWLLGGGGHTITFSAADLVRVSDTDRFVITGGASSTVKFSDSGWTWGGLINNGAQNLFTKDGATLIADWAVRVDGFSYNASVDFAPGSVREIVEDSPAASSGATGYLQVIDSNPGQAKLLPSMLEGLLTAVDAQGNPLSSKLQIGASLNEGYYFYGYFIDNSSVQSLGAEKTRDDFFTVTTIDGTQQTLKFTVVGINDAPELTGTPATLGNGSEDTPYVISVADLLAGYTDVDIGDTLNVANITATNGTLSVTPVDGKYTFTPVPNFNGIVELTYNIADSNGGSLAVDRSFTIEAVNDPAKITIASGSTTSVTEDTEVESGNILKATGTVTINDPDVGEATVSVSAAPGAVNYGTLGIVNTGAGMYSYTYTVNNLDTRVQALSQGGSYVDKFEVTSPDGTSVPLQITINGKDEAIKIIEPTGYINFADRSTIAVEGSIQTGTGISNYSFTASATNDPRLDGFSVSYADGEITWKYDVIKFYIDYLRAAETITQSFDIQWMATDGLKTERIDIVIEGTADPVSPLTSSTNSFGNVGTSGRIYLGTDENDRPSFSSTASLTNIKCYGFGGKDGFYISDPISNSLFVGGLGDDIFTLSETFTAANEYFGDGGNDTFQFSCFADGTHLGQSFGGQKVWGGSGSDKFEFLGLGLSRIANANETAIIQDFDFSPTLNGGDSLVLYGGNTYQLSDFELRGVNAQPGVRTEYQLFDKKFNSYILSFVGTDLSIDSLNDNIVFKP